MFSPGPRPEAVQCGFPFLARVGLVELPQPQGRNTRASSHSTLQVPHMRSFLNSTFYSLYKAFLKISRTFLFFAPDIFHILFLFLQWWARLTAVKVLTVYHYSPEVSAIPLIASSIILTVIPLPPACHTLV
jgi:hypothetical protein